MWFFIIMILSVAIGIAIGWDCWGRDNKKLRERNQLLKADLRRYERWWWK